MGRQSVSDTALCRKLKMSRTTVWQWKRDNGFRSWLRSSLQRTSDENWPLIVRRHEALAIQGSVRSAEFVLKVKQISSNEAGVQSPPGSGYIFNILVPRPPELPD
jgi:hypothetical protein